MEDKGFQQLSIRFWSKPGEDVCLIVCEPTIVEVVNLLGSLSTLCRKDAPADLATLAFETLQSDLGKLLQPSPPSPPPPLPPPPSPPPPPTSTNNRRRPPPASIERWEELKRKYGYATKEESDSVSSKAPLVLNPSSRRSNKDDTTVSGGGASTGSAKAFEKVNDIKDDDSGLVPDVFQAALTVQSDPVTQEMLDRFAFRKKAVKKGEHSAVCSECSRGGYTEMTLRMHLQDMHNYLPCKACRKIYPGEAGLKEHRCPLQNLTCDKCPKKFGSLDGWKLHMRTVHGGVLCICHVCGQQLSNCNTLRSHMESRHGIMPPPMGHRGRGVPRVPPPCYTCHQCGKQVKNRISLREHERRIHGGNFRSAPCKFCGRVFCSGFSLKRHMASVHRGQKEGWGKGGKTTEEQEEEEEELECRYHR